PPGRGKSTFLLPEHTPHCRRNSSASPNEGTDLLRGSRGRRLLVVLETLLLQEEQTAELTAAGLAVVGATQPPTPGSRGQSSTPASSVPGLQTQPPGQTVLSVRRGQFPLMAIQSTSRCIPGRRCCRGTAGLARWPK